MSEQRKRPKPPTGEGDPRTCRYCAGTVRWSDALMRWLGTGNLPGTCPSTGLDHQVWAR